jgi:hypothetical protein
MGAISLQALALFVWLTVNRHNRARDELLNDSDPTGTGLQYNFTLADWSAR